MSYNSDPPERPGNAWPPPAHLLPPPGPPPRKQKPGKREVHWDCLFCAVAGYAFGIGTVLIYLSYHA